MNNTDLEQGTKEWLENRLNGIGSSDAPIVMGKSLYKTKLKLWDEKFNKIIDNEGNQFIFEKGHRIEAWARPGLEFQTGLSWRPALFEHPNFSFIRASLDGWNSEVREFWECKFMGAELWETLSDETKTVTERIPPQYYDQIMHQFFTTGAKRARLTGVMELVTNKEERAKQKAEGVEQDKKIIQLKQYTLVIERTEEMDDYINKVLAPALFAFWKSIQEGVRPEVDKLDVLPVENEELKELVITYGKLLDQQKDLKSKAESQVKKILGDIPEKVEELKSAIENHAARNHGKMEIEGFKLTEKRGKEMVDYQAAFEAFVGWIKSLKGAEMLDQRGAIMSFPEEPNLEKYTKAGKPSFVITVPKAKKEKATADSVSKESDPGEPIKPKDKLAEWKSLTPEQQAAVGKSNAFKNPETGKKPRGWDGKTREERIKYLRTQSKTASEPAKKAMLELAEDLEKLDKREEKIGGITFE